METKETKKNGLKLALNIIFYTVLGLVAVYSLVALFSEQNLNTTSVFGISSLSVQSDSMSGTFEKGDLIFVDTTFDVEDIDVDDVITYRMQIEIEGEDVWIINSHRVKAINEIGGTYWYQTKGDANATYDADAVYMTDVQGIWTGGKIAGAGAAVDGMIGFLKSPTGFFLFIVVPCFAFLVYEVVKFVKVVSDYNVSKAVGDRDQLKADALAAARAEIEAERKAQEEAAKKA